MLKRIKLWYKLNKFYAIFADALGTVDHVSFKALKDDFVLASCGFDVAEAIEAQSTTFNEKSYALSRWLNKLYEDICGKGATIH